MTCQNGQGTALDAAQYFKDSGESEATLRKEGIPLERGLVKEALALSKLDDFVFSAVKRGELSQDHGIAIGNKLTNPDLQSQAYKAITKASAKGKPLTKGIVDEILDAIGAAPRQTETEQSLFGDFDTERSLYNERAQVAAAIKRQLGEDRSLFGIAAKKSGRLAEGGTQVDVGRARELQESAAEALGVFDTLKNRRGTISDILDAGARDVAAGRRPDAVAKGSYAKIKQAVSEAVRGTTRSAVERGPEPRQRTEGEAGERAVAPDTATAGRPLEALEQPGLERGKKTEPQVSPRSYPTQRAIDDLEADPFAPGTLVESRHVADVYDADFNLKSHIVMGRDEEGTALIAHVPPESSSGTTQFLDTPLSLEEYLDETADIRDPGDLIFPISQPDDTSSNFGPGTMRAGETIPEVKERKFGIRFTEDERIAQEIRDSIGTAKYYEPIPEHVTAAEAKRIVDERGIQESIRLIRDERNDVPFHVRNVMGQVVIQRINQTYRKLKDSNPAEADVVLEQGNEVAEFLMDFGTRLGQGVQSFAMWSRQTPEGILLTFKKAARKARERQEKLFGADVAEILRTLNAKMSDVERVEALKDLFKTNQTARKIKTDFDKLLQAAKTGKLTDTLFYEIVGDKLGLLGYDKALANQITDLANQIEAAPEGLPRNKLVQQLQRLLAEQKGFDVWDLPLGIFYGNILSGYNTHAVNFADTGLNVISEINGLAMTNPRAAAKIYGGLLRGFTEGRWDAMLELTQGRMVTDGKWLDVPRLMEIAKFGKKGGVPIKTETRAGRVAKRIAESKIAIPLNAYKYVTRAMAASDALMFRAAKEARSSLLAYRMAQGEGLTGSGLDARVREILALDREADFLAQAKREGLTGNQAKFRAKELREMVRDKGLTSDAVEFAGEATYNHTPHGTLGLFAEKIGGLSDRFKPLKLFVPFTRIVANVTNRGLNYTPYGIQASGCGMGLRR